MLSGACLCGAVQLAVEDAFETAFYCHCSRCRRRTGSAFASLGGIPSDKLRVVAGEEHVVRVSESDVAYDCVCGRCHSSLFSFFKVRKFVHVPLGILADEPNLKPSQHIYVGSKAPWHELTDALPKHDELPGDQR